jgi:type VI secretion system protein ImpB
MAKEGSVAPKERVNIVYRPATGDAKEEVELPLKLLILGDFTHSPDDRTVEDRKPINIDKDTFNEVLNAHKLKLDLNVPDKISGEPDQDLALSLKFESLKDFDPEAIVKQTPELNNLLELRDALNALKGPMSNVPDFRKRIQELITDETKREQLLNELKPKEEE